MQQKACVVIAKTLQENNDKACYLSNVGVIVLYYILLVQCI